MDLWAILDIAGAVAGLLSIVTGAVLFFMDGCRGGLFVSDGAALYFPPDDSTSSADSNSAPSSSAAATQPTRTSGTVKSHTHSTRRRVRAVRFRRVARTA